MENLAIFGLVMLCGVALALQHVGHALFRMKDDDFIILGLIAIAISCAMLYAGFQWAMEIW